MSSETPFGNVATRLCLLRRKHDGAEIEMPLDVDGFLDVSVDPLADGGELTAGALVDPADVLASGALVLLGEPGVGKSTTFREVIDEGASNVVWIDGAELAHSTFEERLGRHLQALPAVDDDPTDDRTLIVVVDQLDESPIVRSIAGHLRRSLNGKDVSRLRLLLACRTADYTATITDALASVGIEVFLADLAPLTRSQAEDLANSVPGVDGGDLIEAAVEAGAGVLASVPLTLWMLIRTCRREGRLEADPRLLFADGVKQLADEPDDSRRRDFASTTGQRVAVAERAAARLLLTAGRTLWRGPLLQAGALDLGVESLVGGSEGLPNGSTVEVTNSLVDETLGTALFSGRGDHRLAFRHNSIAAYLAASHLVARRVPPRQLESLFLVAGFEGIRTIPTLLRETAAWLVTLNWDNAEWLVDADPQSLAAHSRIVDSDSVRALIVESLLKRADEVELSDVSWVRSPRRLAHEGLADQLRAVLEAAGDEEPADWPAKARVRLAVRLAREAAVPGLADELLHIVESETWSPHLRQLAALTAYETDESASAPRLREVLQRLVDVEHATEVDPDDELRGTLLSLLWPKHLHVEEVLPHLRPRRDRDLFGLYLRFEHTFPETLDEQDLPAVLEWAREVVGSTDSQTTAVSPDDPYAPEFERKQGTTKLDEELLDGLINRALWGPAAADRTDDAASLILPRFKRHDRVPFPAPLDVVDAMGQEAEPVRDLRRSLARELLLLVASNEDPQLVDSWLVINGWSNSARRWGTSDAFVPEGLTRAGRSRLLMPEDFEWAYHEAASARDRGDRELCEQFVELASTLFNPTDGPSIDLVYSDQDHPFWDQLKHWFEAIELDSSRADKLREMHRSDEDEEEPHPGAGQFVEDQRRRLDDAASGDTAAFWHLLWGLQFRPETLQRYLRLDDDVAAFPGMAVFPNHEDAVRRLTDAALIYVAAEDDHRDEWLGTDHYDKRAWAGYIALALIERQGHLDRVQDSDWPRWVGALVWFPAVPVNAGDRDVKARLLEQAASHAPQEIADAAAKYLRGELARGNLASEIRLVDPAWAPPLADVWRQLVTELSDAFTTSDPESEVDGRGRPPGLVRLPAGQEARGYAVAIWEKMLEGLLRADGGAENVAIELLRSGMSEGEYRNLAVRAALVLLRHDALRWWDEIQERARQDPDFGRRLAMAAVAARYDQPILGDLQPAGLAEVYRWLSELFPPDEDAHRRGVHFVSPEEQAREWRDGVLHQLSARAALDENAVLELARLADEYPERLVISSNLVRAKALAGESGWQPPEPDELAKMLDDARRRFVRSNAELAQVVLEILEDVAVSVEDHGDLLWDRVPKRLAGGDSAVWLPKPEAAVSAYLTNALRHRLVGRQVIVNREVLVRPTDEYGAGDSTDILVETPAQATSLGSAGYGRAAVVLELKGAWNPELGAAQRSQLAVRYLPEVNTDAGIYVVAWFPLELWTDHGDYRRGLAAAIDRDDLINRLHRQAEEIRAEFRVVSSPVLLSVPRSHRAQDDAGDEADSSPAAGHDSSFVGPQSAVTHSTTRL